MEQCTSSAQSSAHTAVDRRRRLDADWLFSFGSDSFAVRRQSIPAMSAKDVSRHVKQGKTSAKRCIKGVEPIVAH